MSRFMERWMERLFHLIPWPAGWRGKFRLAYALLVVGILLVPLLALILQDARIVALALPLTLLCSWFGGRLLQEGINQRWPLP